MRKVRHGGVVLLLLSVMALALWSVAYAHSDAGGAGAEELEVTGVIEAIDASSVTVDGITYQLTELTEQEGLLEIGATVEIEYVVGADGTFTAEEIELEADEDDQDSTDVDDDAEDDDEDDDEEEEEDDEEDDDEDDEDDEDDDDEGEDGEDD